MFRQALVVFFILMFFSCGSGEREDAIQAAQKLLPPETPRETAIAAARLLRERRETGEEGEKLALLFKTVVSTGVAGRWMQGAEADGVEFEKWSEYRSRIYTATGQYPRNSDVYIAVTAVKLLSQYKDWSVLIEYAKQLSLIDPQDKSLEKFFKTRKLVSKPREELSGRFRQ